MNDDQLSLLSKTIAAHAHEVAGKEWKDEHCPGCSNIEAPASKQSD